MVEQVEMRRYNVSIRNEMTDEVVDLEKDGRCLGDAQVAALACAFKEWGWRRCTTVLDPQ